MLLCNVSCAANQFLQPNPAFNPYDLAPVIVLGHAPNVLAVGAGVRVGSLSDFIALARAQPGKLSLASSGPGSSSNLSAELLKFRAQLNIVDVPYRGSSAAIPDILSGRVDGMVMGVPESLALLREGRLKALAVTSEKRAAALPDVPTFAEAGVPGYSFPGWLSLFAPKQTPAPLLERLNAVFNRALHSRNLTARFAEQNIEPAGGPPDVALALLRSDLELWKEVLQRKPR
ncbi:MAG: tripartite tricarboxylate transporter substrate-binding protein [Xanthobacteraceae bacterium]